MAPAPRQTPRWVVRLRTGEWSRDRDRALIAEGWDRLRQDEVIACGVPVPSEVIARDRVLKVLGVRPDDVLTVGLDLRSL